MNTHEAMIPPAVLPETLGSSAFRRDHGVRLAYMAGAMANGIASEALVTAMARAGLLASFGAAGLPQDAVLAAVARIQAALGAEAPYCVNLIHQIGAPEAELALVEGLLSRGVRCIEASAFTEVAPAMVLFRAAGLAGAAAPTRVIVKLSHPRLAEACLLPPSQSMLDALLRDGRITAEQAAAAAEVPLATDVTVEADSGGHTDRRPLTVLFPLIAQLRQRLALEHPATAQVRLGAAGGLGTPEALAAAFAMGADYVVTGSINQATCEARMSELGKELLCKAQIDDTAMAPAADMFEIGAEVQVLRRGTMFAQKATRLGALFRRHDGLAALSDKDRTWLETQVLRQGIAETVAEVADYFAPRDPALAARMRNDPKTEMALVFRWYLGKSSGWARDGVGARQPDMQLWCGPAMGAFNAFVAGTEMEDPSQRRVARIADLLMTGAADHLSRPMAQVAVPGVMPVAEPEPVVPSRPAPVPPKVPTALTADAVEDMIVAEMAARLGLSEDDIDPDEPFDGTALDSAQAVVMVSKLEAALGQKLSPTLVWNYPTPRKLAERLAARAALAVADGAAPA